MLLGGTAVADRHHHHNGGVVVREHRGPARGPVVVRGGGHARVVVNNGRYVFPGGVVRVYRRPAIRHHYHDRRVRPALIVESYDPVPGYVWVAGNWTWGGSEWVWSSGYWAVADQPPPPPAPVVNGGVSISAGISIH
jgi:hypothetical protein